MTKTILNALLTITIAGILITGCKKEEIRPAPTIAFHTGSDFISSDASVFAGDTVLIGIKCSWNGTDAIKILSLYANNSMVGNYQISEQNAHGFEHGFIIIKTDAPTELWVFEVTDSQGEKSSVSLTLTVDNSGGIILNFESTIGAQDNTTEYGYYSSTTHSNYNATDAQTNYDKIDFLGAYDVTNAFLLLSPAAPVLPEPYLTEMSDWTSKNNTLFCSTTMSPEQFDFINRDNLLINSFSTNVADQKNEAKKLVIDDVYSFKTNSGKYGLFKVTSVTSGITGKVTIDIKIQP